MPSVPGNALNIKNNGVVYFNGTATFSEITGVQSGFVLTDNGPGIIPSFQTVSASGAITHVTGNSGGPEYPSLGNFNFLTANATPTFVGTSATETLDFGLNNLILGNSGTTITSAANTTGYGSLCLTALTSGQNNACYGYASGRFITSGTSNSCFGAGAGSAITTSLNNTAIGEIALNSFTSGAANLGKNTAVGAGSLDQVTSGTNNTALGFNAGHIYTGTESSNICIGNTGTLAESNAIHIGTQGSGAAQQNTCYIAGIVGVTVASPTVTTINSSTGQLGNLAQLTVPLGGTGDASFTAYAVICGGTSSTAALQNVSGVGTSAQVLTSNGAAALPTWQAIPSIGTVTQYDVLVGGAAGLIASVGPGTAGQVLQSAGNAAAPAYSTATYPLTTTVSQILYSSATNVVSGLATANRSVLTTGTTGIPVLTALAVDGQVLIGSTAGTPTAATLTQGAGITITNASNSITIATTTASIVWSVITANQSAVVNNGYVCNKASALVLTLPASAAVGDIIEVTGINTALGWQVAQNANQQIFFGTSSTTLGAGGSLASSATRDSIKLLCVVAGASTVYNVISAVGNITIV